MDKFEQQFEHLDVQANYMETAMSDTATLTVPQVGRLSLVSHYCSSYSIVQDIAVENVEPL